MRSSIRVLHFGLGPIGAAIARQIAGRRGLTIVGAVDIDPTKVGEELSKVIGFPKRLGVKVHSEAAKALEATTPDVVVHCTSSSLKAVLPQLATIIRAKTPIVSTTEELSYPGHSNR